MMGTGVFQYFLPLMTILGDIIDIHHLTQHPRFGYLSLEALVLQVECSLESFAISLCDFEETATMEFTGSVPISSNTAALGTISDKKPSQPPTLDYIRLKAVINYSKHLLHVLHILLHSSWDPISMLDGVDWITPASFMKCATHAISAAKAVEEILLYDPELSLMPYLFGIYLLHGSFILLAFAESMDMAASETISQACETIIRAHEVCATILSTQYQVCLEMCNTSSDNYAKFSLLNRGPSERLCALRSITCAT